MPERSVVTLKRRKYGDRPLPPHAYIAESGFVYSGHNKLHPCPECDTGWTFGYAKRCRKCWNKLCQSRITRSALLHGRPIPLGAYRTQSGSVYKNKHHLVPCEKCSTGWHRAGTTMCRSCYNKSLQRKTPSVHEEAVGVQVSGAAPAPTPPCEAQKKKYIVKKEADGNKVLGVVLPQGGLQGLRDALVKFLGEDDALPELVSVCTAFSVSGKTVTLSFGASPAPVQTQESDCVVEQKDVSPQKESPSAVHGHCQEVSIREKIYLKVLKRFWIFRAWYKLHQLRLALDLVYGDSIGFDELLRRWCPADQRER